LQRYVVNYIANAKKGTKCLNKPIRIEVQVTRGKEQDARRKVQGARLKGQEGRRKNQETRNKNQGTRHKVQGGIPEFKFPNSFFVP
jgi:hypothetical protein